MFVFLILMPWIEASISGELGAELNEEDELGGSLEAE